MPPDRNRLIEDISQSSLALDPHERTAYIEQACGDDADLKNAVEARLAQYQQARAYFGDLAQRLGLGSLDDPRLAVVEGRHLGKYRIDRLIGQGGMGIVRKHDRMDRRSIETPNDTRCEAGWPGT